MPANDLKSEYDPCPVCDSSQWMKIREGRDLCRPELKKSFSLTRCCSCGHVSRKPQAGRAGTGCRVLRFRQLQPLSAGVEGVRLATVEGFALLDNEPPCVLAKAIWNRP